MAGRKQLSAHDWAAAALDALAAGGLSDVAVEPIAARLGATKGSFYWHFRNRDALVGAALELWETRNTEAVIDESAAEPDARAALRAVLSRVLGSVTAAGRGHSVEVALQADDRHPLVAPALERVSRRRIAYLRELFERLGFGPADAEHRALLAFTAYLGHVRLARATPALVPDGPELTSYLDALLDVLTSGTPTP